jgi:hypothetical protein
MEKKNLQKDAPLAASLKKEVQALKNEMCRK